jgi:hypothetical protein
MSDRNENDRPTQASSAAARGAGGLPVSMSRRRFARAGAAAPVVLGSLVSKPVLAGEVERIYHCTISGQLSGNLSAHPNQIDCKTLGRSPGYWKNHLSWPGGVIAGTLPNNSCSFSGGTQGTAFNGYSSGGAVLGDAFRRKSANSLCMVYDVSEGAVYTGIDASKKATMLQVLNTGGGLNETSLKALGRATVAALLNAHAFGESYPLTTAQVIQMFNAVYKGGVYMANGNVPWDANKVKTFFESTYGNA